MTEANDKRKRARPISYVASNKLQRISGAHPRRPHDLMAATREYKRNEPKYKPLGDDETRLVVLKQYKQPEDPVMIQLLENIKFSELNDFEALSYHWGHQPSSKAIYYLDEESMPESAHTHHDNEEYYQGLNPGHAVLRDGSTIQELNKRIEYRHRFPRQNLYNALFRLRQPDQDVRIWVDAICINQADDEEKSRQVERMSEIYSKADTVVIWLGEGDDKTNRAIEFVDKIIRDPKRIASYVKTAEFTNSWQDLLHLMRSSWFSRRWIIQELALARDAVVCCGAKVVHWDDLRDAISIFVDNFDAIRENFKRTVDDEKDYNALGEIEPLHAKKLVDCITSIFREHRYDSKKVTMEPLQGLEYLVSNLAALDASDPRDTINAFRNIAKETYEHRTEGPRKHGYTIDLLTVYVSFVRWIVRETGCIDIILRRWAVPEKQQEDINYKELVSLPSWIQTVDDEDRSNAVPGQRRHGDPFVSLPTALAYSACHNLKAEVSFGLKSDERAFRPGHRHMPSFTIHEATPAPLTADDEQVNGGASQQDSQPSQNGASDSQTLSQRAPQANTSLSNEARIQTNVIKAWPIPPSRGNSALHLDPAPSARPSHVRRPSASSISVPGSPISVHMPELSAKSVLRQLIRKDVDASLYAKGIVVGTLSSISHNADGVINRNVFYALYGNDRKIDLAEQIPDVVWRTLVAERGPNNTVAPALYARACQYAMGFLNPNDDLNVKALREDPPADFMRPFLKRVEAVIWDRCFFKVDQEEAMSYHGFGPYGARSGDVLCILYGCNVPCILRPFETRFIEGTCYRMVGEAYVYGIMEGDFIRSLKEDDLNRRSKTFRIL